MKGFKFVTTLVLEFKKIENYDETKYKAPFIIPQKLTQLLMREILMIYLSQSIVRLYQTYKNVLERVQVGLLIQL